MFFTKENATDVRKMLDAHRQVIFCHIEEILVLNI